MRYDRDVGYGRAPERYGIGEPMYGRGEYGEPYERPYVPYEAPYLARFHGYGMGYLGGSLRSRGSFEAGQIRSALNPYDEFEFEWGDGYVGGRGYGGTNYDYEHGYRSSAAPRPAGRPRRGRPETGPPPARPPGGGGRPEEMRAAQIPHGPARYGYGPYHDRLRRRRRADDEIREDVDETLFYDTWVDADAIRAEVEDGVVTLRGTLPNYDEVRYATDDAWDVDGVRGVRTELNVERMSATDRLGRRREFSAGEIAAENEATLPGGGRPPAAGGAAERERSGGETAGGETAGGGRSGGGRSGGEPSGREAPGGEATRGQPTGREPHGSTEDEEGGGAGP